jgi:hypothetical protein
MKGFRGGVPLKEIQSLAALFILSAKQQVRNYIHWTRMDRYDFSYFEETVT